MHIFCCFVIFHENPGPASAKAAAPYFPVTPALSHIFCATQLCPFTAAAGPLVRSPLEVTGLGKAGDPQHGGDLQPGGMESHNIERPGVNLGQ